LSPDSSLFSPHQARRTPDGRRIACSTSEVDEDFKRTGPCRVEIYDADGKGRPQVLLEEGAHWLTVTDWR